MVSDGPRSVRLHLDPTRCVGYGVCGGLLPEWVSFDDWGYPIIRADALPARLLEVAARAVHACPGEALRLEADDAES